MSSSQNGTPSNISAVFQRKYRYPELWTVPSAISYVIIIIVIVVGNSLVIASYATNQKLRTKTYLFFVSLAVADLLVAVVSIPMWMYLLLTQDYSNAKLQIGYLFFDTLSGLSSILNLTAISVERWYAITKPVKHRNLPKKRVVVIIFFAWMTALILSSITCDTSDKKRTQIYMFLLIIFLFLVPLAIIAIAYWQIYKASGRILNSKKAGISFKKDLRNAITIGIVIGAFAICWMPFFALILITFTLCRRSCPFLRDMRTVIVIKMMHYGNSAINPIIYASRIPEFKKTFCKLVGRLVVPRSFLRSTRESTMSVLRRASTRATSASSTYKRESTIPLENSDIFYVSSI